MTRFFLLPLLLVVLIPGWFGAAAVQQDAKPPPVDKLPKPGPVDPPNPEAFAGAIQRGVAFLLKDQNKNGS